MLSIVIFGVACSSTKVVYNTGRPATDIVLNTADGLQGTPYCSAGSTTECFDCSGFVNYCFSKAGIVVPRTTTELFATGTLIDVVDMRPGDLLFFNTTGRGVSHVGIVIDAQHFIHSSTSSGVIKTTLADPYWNKRFLGVRRL